MDRDSNDLYFDKQGKPISIMRWRELHEDEDYLQIAFDVVPEVAEAIWDAKIEIVSVSTVWIGINQNWRRLPPVIFETMIFGGPYNHACRRYTAEEAAVEGHRETVEHLRAGRPLPWAHPTEENA